MAFTELLVFVLSDVLGTQSRKWYPVLPVLSTHQQQAVSCTSKYEHIKRPYAIFTKINVMYPSCQPKLQTCDEKFQNRGSAWSFSILSG